MEEVQYLNALLSDYQVLRQNLYSHHWNVKSQWFLEIHAYMQELYEDVETKIDLIAEQIRILGFTPYSKMSQYLKNSLVKETEVLETSIDILNKTLLDYKVVDSRLRIAFESGLEPGTEDLIQGFIKQEGKKIWFLKSQLGK